eukprot:Platyproteum_vivax@DN3129_c0_g1_i1.p1
MGGIVSRAYEVGETLVSVTLTEDGLINYAKSKSKVDKIANDEFSETFIREPLAILSEEWQTTAKLTLLGRMLTFRMFGERLANIPLFYKYQEAFPEIRQIEFKKPIFVLGMNRSGTTICFRILSNDSRLRSPYFFEMALPFGTDGCFDLNRTGGKHYQSPVPNTEFNAYIKENGVDPRKVEADRLIGMVMYAFGPEWQKVHPTSPNLPEEEIVMFETILRNYNVWAFYNCPQWREWFMKHDMTLGYLFFKRFLQQLQWLKWNHEQWLLKMPFHMQDIDKLFEAFPDAHVVVMHRDPVDMLPSWCSLVAHGRNIFSNQVKEKEIGPTELQYQADMVEKFMKFRSVHPELKDRFVDIQYKDILAHPLKCMKTVYETFGMDLTGDLQTKMMAFMDSNAKDKHGRHRYTCEQFGLTPEDIQKAFANYYESGYLHL